MSGRWCCLPCVAIASYVAFFRTGIVYSSRSRYQVPGFFSGVRAYARERVPSPSLPRSSLGPEPEPSSLDSEMDDPEPSSLDSEMDDTLSLPEPPREPEHPSVSLRWRAFTGTAEVYHLHAI